MSDKINDCEEYARKDKCLYSKLYSQGWELETSDFNPVRYYKPEDSETEERIDRWLEFIDR